MQIDICGLKEAYACGELGRIGWLPGTSNLADTMTKEAVKDASPLVDILRSNKLRVKPEAWATVSHEITKSETLRLSIIVTIDGAVRVTGAMQRGAMVDDCSHIALPSIGKWCAMSSTSLTWQQLTWELNNDDDNLGKKIRDALMCTHVDHLSLNVFMKSFAILSF